MTKHRILGFMMLGSVFGWFFANAFVLHSTKETYSITLLMSQLITLAAWLIVFGDEKDEE